MASAAATDQLETMMELAACGSLEMNADRAGDARTIADLLPTGTKVYVNHLPRNALSETLKSLEALCAAGLAARQDGRKTYAITDAGRVVVNTGMGFEAPVHKRNYDAVSTAPIRYILLTQGHVDHVDIEVIVDGQG